MVRTWIVSSVLLFGAGTAQAAPDAAIPAGPGSYAFWAHTYGSSVDRYSEKIVRAGDGYELFELDDEYKSGEPSDFYALFSGIYYTSCDDVMPTADERDALKGLFPLTPDKTVQIGTSDDGTKISVQTPTEYFLMGKTWPAHTVKIEYAGEEPSEEVVTVLNDMPITVRIDWDEDSKDTLLLVTKPKPDATPELDTDLIGNCASLLNE